MNTQPSVRHAAARSAVRRMLIPLLAACACSAALAQSVTVSDAWARATVPGQKAAGVFMTLRSPLGGRLRSVASPAAALGQVHEMRMEGDIMKMHALKDGLDIPAGKAVELKPGSYHVMLMDLKAPLLKDTTIALTLVFVDAKGVESKTELTVPVQAMGHMPHSEQSGPAGPMQK